MLVRDLGEGALDPVHRVERGDCKPRLDELGPEALGGAPGNPAIGRPHRVAVALRARALVQHCCEIRDGIEWIEHGGGFQLSPGPGEAPAVRVRSDSLTNAAAAEAPTGGSRDAQRAGGAYGAADGDGLGAAWP